MAMYLTRRKRKNASGIYQASSFTHKSGARRDLKVGGYFLSQAACEEFDKYERPTDLNKI